LGLGRRRHHGAGGWAIAEGYHTMSFAGVGDDYPVRREIRAMYKSQGRKPPKVIDDTVLYNRGILWAALHVEAIRNALQDDRRQETTARTSRRVSNRSRISGLGGLVPPLKVTAEDHEAAAGSRSTSQGRQVRQADRLDPRVPEVVRGPR